LKGSEEQATAQAATRFHRLVSVKKKEKRRRRRPANEAHPEMASMIQVDQPTDNPEELQITGRSSLERR